MAACYSGIHIQLFKNKVVLLFFPLEMHSLNWFHNAHQNRCDEYRTLHHGEKSVVL